MKVISGLYVGLVLLGLASASLEATPDRVVTVTERLLGTSAEGFAVLRVERDNRGSYYSSDERHFLDIYGKNDSEERPGLAVKISTVLLLDRTSSKHADEPNDAPPVLTINKMAEPGEPVSLPHLIAKFSEMPEKWADEKSQRLESHPTAGVSLDRYNLIWGGWVKERFGVERNDELEWKLEDVAEDSNSLFLRVSSENQMRWVCILPEATKQVRERLVMKEFYLVAGTFETEEAAITMAREINEKRKESKFFGFDLEIWSERQPTDKISYLVVSGLTQDSARTGMFPKLEEIFGVDLEVHSSLRFEERIFFK